MADICIELESRHPRSKVYEALATRDGLAGWWTIDTKGESKPGDVLRFRFSADGREIGGFDMKVLDLRPAAQVLWQVTEGPAEWLGTKVSFDLKQEGDYCYRVVQARRLEGTGGVHVPLQHEVGDSDEPQGAGRDRQGGAEPGRRPDQRLALNGSARPERRVVQWAAERRRGGAKANWLVVGCAALALGCSSALSPSPSGPPEVASFCKAVINAAADRSYACEGGSREALDAQLQATDFCNAAAVAIGAAHVKFDAGAAAACVADVPHLACWQNLGASPNCTKVFTGTVAEGGALPDHADGRPGMRARHRLRRERLGLHGHLRRRRDHAAAGRDRQGVHGHQRLRGRRGHAQLRGTGWADESGTGTCQVPADRPCTYDGDCLTGACAGASGTTRGTCQPPSTLATPARRWTARAAPAPPAPRPPARASSISPSVSLRR